MRTRVLSTIAIAALTLSACGGGGDKAEAVDDVIAAAEEAGLELDRSCVEDVADELSDDDLKKLAEAGPDDDVDLSPEGEALTDDLLGCVSSDSMVDSIIASIGDQEGLDEDCLRDKLRDINPAELAEGDLPPGIFDCIDLGG